jgi:diacylglycerol kinase (ATP)
MSVAVLCGRRRPAGERQCRGVANREEVVRLLRGNAGKYLIVINPMSRMGKGLRTALWVIARLVLRRVDFEAVLTKRAGHAEKIVAEYEGAVDVVVALGGDGTIQEVVNGIMKRDQRPALAVFPAGRGNDFCYLMGFKKSKKKAFKAMLSKYEREVDLLKVNDRYASNVVGLGYDASVQEKAQNYKYFPVAHYIFAALYLIFKHPPKLQMHIEHANGTWDGEFLITVIGHTRKYARHIRMFPGLQMDGGVMKIAAFRPGSTWFALLVLALAGVGLCTRVPQCLKTETPWVEVTPGQTIKAQADGELFFVGQDETLRIELLRSALRVKALAPGK